MEIVDFGNILLEEVSEELGEILPWPWPWPWPDPTPPEPQCDNYY